MRHKSQLALVLLALAFTVFFAPPGVLRADDPPAPPIVTTDGTCQNLDNIPIANLSPPLTEPLAPWRVTQKYNTAISDPHYNLGHNGVDLGGEFKSDKVGVEKITNVLDGKVLISRYRAGWGNSIAVVSRLHPASKVVMTTHYHHLHVRYLSHCAVVKPGQLVGLEGKTGNPSYAPHLHFTVRYWASVDHLKKWLSKTDGEYLVFGNDAYFGHDGIEFRGSYEPGVSKIDQNSPYIHYGHLHPVSFLHNFFYDYGDGDVDPSVPYAWSSEYAKKMRSYGIELGEWNGQFGASMHVQRREAARWLRTAIGPSANTTSGTQIFADVPSSDPDYPYIQDLTQYPMAKSVVNPTHSCMSGGGFSFCPNAEVNRAEALKMVVLSFYGNEFADFYKKYFWLDVAASVPSNLAFLLHVSAGALFSDVDINAWYAPYVYFGVLQGIVTLQPMFNPTGTVARAELAKWVVLGYEKLHGAGVTDPCKGISCPGGMYCDVKTGTCASNAECVPAEGSPCEVGGGLSQTPPGCPNGFCDAGETCSSCPQDCGTCPPGCPDGTCSGSETCFSCPQDCGACAPMCPDGQCNGSESCSSCPQDCGTCPPGCPDGTCNGSESCSSCPQDCGACPPMCPDGQCNGSETCSTCPQDCAPCGCMAASYWSPTLASDTDSTGSQSGGTISTGITVDVRQATTGSGLEARVCKTSGLFTNNVAFSIYDAATNSTVGATISNLATANQSCSGWVGLQNSTGYANGQQFGGTWQVVSPASSAADWSWPYSACPVNGSPTGTCWNGFNITLTRTCK